MRRKIGCLRDRRHPVNTRGPGSLTGIRICDNRDIDFAAKLRCPRWRFRSSVLRTHPVFHHGLSAIIATERDMLLVAHAANATYAIEQF
jgi:hypothetical protein